MRNKIFFVFFLLLATLKLNAQVTITSSDSISCSQLCTTLTATVTGDNPTNAGITVDDTYPPSALPIGFTFTFYGVNYTQALIGPNGTICFNTALAGSFSPWTISGPLLGNTSVLNSFCGPWCDIDITNGGTITYSTTGIAPFRKFIVTFCATHMFSCIDQATTAQMILYETTNILETHIGSKPICTDWNPSSPAGAGGRAIIGVQNAAGTAATAAPGRDFPAIYACNNEAWRFTPDPTGTSYTAASIAYAPVPLASSAVYWYNATTNTFLGTGATKTVCPTSTTTYKAGALTCADTSFAYYTVVPSATVSANFTVFAPIVTCGATTSITVSGLMPDSVYTVYYTYNGVPTSFVATASPTGTIIINGTAAGNYTNMYVSLGICNSATQSLTIAPPPLPISATPHNPTVCGYPDGYIVLTGYWPTTGYNISYTKNGTSVAAALYTSDASGSITIPSLLAGTYTNIASTGGPCPPTTVAGPVVLVNPAPPTLSVDSTLVKTCVGIPAQLHVYSSAPSIPEYYTWSPATNLNNATVFNPVATPTATGNINYIVTGTTAAGVAECNSTANVIVHAEGDFTIATAPATICLLTPRVQVPVTISGSTNPEYHYLWTSVVPGTTDVVTPTSQNPTITPILPGLNVYTVTATYAACPPYTHTYSIMVDTQARGIVVRDTICLGMSDVIDMSASGGPGYHYQWTSNPTGVTFSNDTIAAPTFTPGAVGTYTLATSVTSPNNAAGCGTLDSVFLLVLPNTLTITPVDTAICAGQVVQVQGTLLYSNLFTYQWLPTAGIPNANLLNALITPDTSQLYVVSASFHKCPDIYATLNLDVQPNPTVYLGGNRPVCQFDTLHLHATVSPAWYGNYSYSWTPSAVLDMTTAQNAVFTGDVSTNVVVTVTTPAGCTGKDSAYITVNAGNYASVKSGDDFCPHESKVVDVTTTGTTATYQWIPSMYVDDSTSASPTLSPITTQTYSIVGTSAAGCNDTVYYTATVYPEAVIELGDSLVLYPGESYTMNPLTNCVSFVWFPITGLSNPFISNPEATPDVSTQYILTGTTEHGCVARDSIAVYVSEESVLNMPNAFIPGSDGANNKFRVYTRGMVYLNYFRIYNRWGNVVFETKNLSEGWDGSFKGEPQEMGVYIYDVQAVTSTGKIVKKTGNVTLLR